MSTESVSHETRKTVCPFCKEEIAEGAIKCKHCSSMFTSVTDSSSIQSLGIENDTPPLFGDHVNNTYIWILAFAPILGHLLERLIASIKYGVYTYTGEYWYTTLVLYILLLILDEQALKKAGHDTSKCAFWIFIFFPMYIYSRTKQLKQNHVCLITWIIVSVLSFVMANFW